MYRTVIRTLIPLVLTLPSGIVLAQASPPSSVEENTQQIQAAIQSYVTAFNARDVEKLVAHWSPDGVYTRRDNGEQVSGREAISQVLQTYFSEAASAPQLVVASESIDVISPNVALERGVSTVTKAGTAMESNYTVVFVKQKGQWLIDRVTEEDIVPENSNRKKLQPLEWLIGEWVDVIGDSTVEFNCQWTSNENYISRTFKVTGVDGVESSGLQIIGWDPIKKQIRSWLFDSDGSYVSGWWTQSENRWVVQSLATLVDGTEGSYTSIFRPLEDGNFGWQKVNRVLDGELLPSIDEVIIQRK